MKPAAKALDTILDRTVVPGYTSIGYSLRQHLWDDPSHPTPLTDAEVLVTGASSGIGEAACERLAVLGARVHMLARRRDRALSALQRIRARLAGAGFPREPRLEIETLDVSDLDAVRAFAGGFASRVPRLRGVVHNAGVLTDERSHTDQGHELTFATAVVGPFLMTRLLGSALAAGSPSTVVFVSSGGMYTARLDARDLELEHRDLDGPRFYAHAKRAQVILAALFAERWNGSGVGFASMHPGWVDTPGLSSSLPGFHRITRPLLRDPGQGADTIVWLLATDAANRRPGAFWHDRRPRPTHRVPRTREAAADRARLWTELCRMTDTKAGTV
jgi:dehydrogenase/reductase SDR family member 12